MNFGVEVSLEELLKLRGLAVGLGLSRHRVVTKNMIGAHASSIRGRGMEFDEVRLYQPGDDVQRIDWRVTSRTGKPHTKLFKEERQRPIHLIVDQRSTMFFGSKTAFKSVVAARLAALYAWSALAHQDKVGAIIVGAEKNQFLKPSSGKKAVLRVISSLVQFSGALARVPVGKEQSTDFATVLRELSAAAHPGALIILLSDFSDFNDECQHFLTLLRRRCDILCCKIFDPMEKKLPPANIYAMSDGFKELHINTRIEALRKRFEDDYEKHTQQLYSNCAKIGVPFLQLSTDDYLPTVLARAFGGMGRTVQRREHES